MGYRLNRLDEPVFMAVSKPMQTEFGIHHRLESCGVLHIPVGGNQCCKWGETDLSVASTFHDQRPMSK